VKYAEKIILGTVQLGIPYGINNHTGKPDRLTAHKLLQTAWDGGICLLDTAESYGNAQEIIGDYHSAQSNRFNVITKLQYSKDPDGLLQSVLNDLELLKVDTLYGFMFHHLDLFKRNPKNLKDLIRLKNDGKIQRIGVSVYTNEDIEFILNYPEINLIQMPYNMLDNWYQRGEYVRLAKDNGIEIHVRSVFLQGLFFKPLSDLPPKLRPLRTYLRQLQELCCHYQMTMEMGAMAYALGRPEFDRVLMGVDTPEQLSGNLNQINQLSLTDEFLKSVDAIQVADTELLSPVNW
jgi:aryl-alcohol dehydrogenase-like predicted oxidoreductase